MFRFFAALVASLIFNVAAQAEDLKVFFGNLHSHTSYSDGVETPRDAFDHARDVAKLDFLAITEHNHRQVSDIATHHELYNGSGSASLMSQAAAFTKPNKFVAIFGQEYSAIGDGNHVNVFEVPVVIDDNLVPNGRFDLLVNTWIPAHPDTTGQPALILLNHPATSGSPNNIEYGRNKFGNEENWVTAMDARAELINLINGPSHQGDTPGKPSEGEFRRYLNLGFHVGPTADQDNHRPDWGSVVDTRTAVIAPALTKPDILAALRARHVYASQDKDLAIIARVAGHLIGTIVSGQSVPASNADLPIEVVIEDDGEPHATYLIEVLSDDIGGSESANVVKDVTHHGNGTASISGVKYNGGNQYVFLRINQHHDDPEEGDKVWTAPVWFEPNAVVPGPAAEEISVANQPAITLAVDLVGELARVENAGAQVVDISGWKVVSTRGEQEFAFNAGTQLAPGQVITLVSGARANDIDAALGEVAWTTQNIWLNSGDVGELRNAQGSVIDMSP